MTATEELLSDEEIERAVEAIDNHHIQSLHALLTNSAQPDLSQVPEWAHYACSAVDGADYSTFADSQDFKNLSSEVKEIFNGDKGQTQGSISKNGGKTQQLIQSYSDGGMTDEQLEAAINEKDSETVNEVKGTLEKSKPKVIAEAKKVKDSKKQKQIIAGRAKENGGIAKHIQEIVDHVLDWVKKTIDEIGKWFKDLATRLANWFKNTFGI